MSVPPENPPPDLLYSLIANASGMVAIAMCAAASGGVTVEDQKKARDRILAIANYSLGFDGSQATWEDLRLAIRDMAGYFLEIVEP